MPTAPHTFDPGHFVELATVQKLHGDPSAQAQPQSLAFIIGKL
jgi:hypothetical protein